MATWMSRLGCIWVMGTKTGKKDIVWPTLCQCERGGKRYGQKNQVWKIDYTSSCPISGMMADHLERGSVDVQTLSGTLPDPGLESS